MEMVEYNDQVVALIFRPDATLKGTNFFTPPEFALQVGFSHYQSGQAIPLHTHTSDIRTIKGSAEIAIVQSGSCQVNLYTDQGTPISSHILHNGDAIVMVSGGHSFQMLEDTLLYVIKQGPYNAEEKKGLAD